MNKFRKVDPTFLARVSPNSEFYVQIGETRYPLNVDEARRLRDWLTAALPPPADNSVVVCQSIDIDYSAEVKGFP